MSSFSRKLIYGGQCKLKNDKSVEKIDSGIYEKVEKIFWDKNVYGDLH